MIECGSCLLISVCCSVLFRLSLRVEDKGRGLITLVSQPVFIEYATSSLVCHVCNPYTANRDPRGLQSAMHVSPKRFVQLLGKCQMQSNQNM